MSEFIGQLWRPKTDKQRDAGIIAQGTIDGTRVTIWKSKTMRDDKQDPHFRVTKDERQGEQGKPKQDEPKPEKEKVEDTPW